MWILFASLNPVSEAFRSVFSKRASRRISPIIISWFNNVFPVALFLPLLFWTDIRINREYLIAESITGIINIITTILYMKSIAEEDISIVIPLLSFTPIFLLFTSPLILGESPNPAGIVGILLIVSGSYLLNIRPHSGDFLAPFRLLFKSRGALYMFIVSFLWSISANFDKVAISNSSVLQHMIFMNLIIFSGTTIYMTIRRENPFPAIRNEWKNIVPMSLLTVFSFIFHMTALSLTIVAYVVALKRASGMISVFLGHFLLNETGLKERSFGSIIMFIGVLVIIFS